MNGRKRPHTRERLEPLDVGCKIHDDRADLLGVVVDSACQYAHPKAEPVYSYLVRWEDGQVNSISESALAGNGLSAID